MSVQQYRNAEDISSAHSMLLKAMEHGALQTGPITWRYEASGRCLNPIRFEKKSVGAPLGVRQALKSHQALVMTAANTGPGETVYIDMAVPCRRCQECLKARSALWYRRAETETRRSMRTWFGTLTLSPSNHHLMLLRAKGFPRDSEHEFAMRHGEIGKEITKWIKRVRKESGALIRYLCVAEAHKSGLPHYHCLIHERQFDRPVRHITLKTQWRLGFSDFKLVVDENVCAYVAKYLSKELMARVRASVLYGGQSPAIHGLVPKCNVKEFAQTATVSEPTPLVTQRSAQPRTQSDRPPKNNELKI